MCLERYNLKIKICGGVAHYDIGIVRLGLPINLYVILGIAYNGKSQEKPGWKMVVINGCEVICWLESDYPRMISDSQGTPRCLKLDHFPQIVVDCFTLSLVFLFPKKCSNPLHWPSPSLLHPSVSGPIMMREYSVDVWIPPLVVSG